MSSIQKFKKEVSLSKSAKSQNSSNRQYQNRSVAVDKLIISASEIVFTYASTSQMLNGSSLSLFNSTSTQLFVKIRSNNPLMYTINPQQDILEHGQAIKIDVRMNITSSNNGRKRVMEFTELEQMTKYDKFQVQWGQISENQMKSSLIPTLTKREVISVKIFDVSIQKKSGNKGELFNQKQKFNYYNQNYDWKNYNQQKADPSSNNILGFNKKIEDYDSNNISEWTKVKEGNRISSQISDQPRSTLLTGPIIAGVAIISFLIGFATA